MVYNQYHTVGLVESFIKPYQLVSQDLGVVPTTAQQGMAVASGKPIIGMRGKEYFGQMLDPPTIRTNVFVVLRINRAYLFFHILGIKQWFDKKTAEYIEQFEKITTAVEKVLGRCIGGIGVGHPTVSDYHVLKI